MLLKNFLCSDLISDDQDGMATNLGEESSRIRFWRIFAIAISIFSILATLAIGVSEFGKE